MIVLDASATVDWLLQTPAGQRIEERIYARKDTLRTVHLLDVEVAQVLREGSNHGDSFDCLSAYLVIRIIKSGK
jgi:predicted nucleic acid-binding protein